MQHQKAESPAAFTPYQILITVLLTVLQFTIVLDFMVLAPLGDILMKSLHISPSGFGIVVSCYAFSAGASGILAAGFADKYDRKKLLLFFYSGFILGTLFCALAGSYWTLLAARIVTGLFGGVIGAISLAIISDLFAINQRGRVMGYVQMAMAGSQILGIPIGLYLANRWGWHSSFLMIVGIAAVAAVVILYKMKPVTRHLTVQSDKNPFQHLLHTLSNKSYQTGFIAVAFLSVGGFMMMPFSSSYLVNNIGISQEQLPLVFLFTGISSIAIMPVIGQLSDRMDRFVLFCIGSALAIVMILIYTNIGPSSLLVVIVINMLMFMGIMSRVIPSMAMNTSIPDLQDRGAYMSITSSLQQMAGGIAAICAGLIVRQAHPAEPLEHYDTLGMVVSVLIVVCCFLIYRVSVMIKNKANVSVPPPLVAESH